MSNSAETANAAAMIPASILIVEDDEVTAKLIERRLQRLGYGIAGVARTGAEALEEAAANHPDMVLMDIRLEGSMDGVEAARRIREYFDVPVAYLTGQVDDVTLARATSTGPYGYVLKPFEEREVHTMIQTALERHRLERELRESRRWLATILSAVGDAVIATDRDGIVRFMNPVAEALTGWRHEEALGSELTRVFRVSWPVKHTADAGEAAGRLARPVLHSKDGKEIPIEESATVARDERGDMVGFVWAFRDAGATQRAEDALARSEQHFRSLIEQSADITVVIDAEGTIYYASPSVEQLLGYRPEDLLGRNALELVHPDDVETLTRALQRTGEISRPSVNVEFRATARDRSVRVLDAFSKRLSDAAGPPRIVIDARDATVRKQHEMQVREEAALSGALLRVGQELIAALDSPRLLDRLCQVTSEVMHADASQTWLWDGVESAFVAVAGHGSTSEEWEALRTLKVPRDGTAGVLERLEGGEVVSVDLEQFRHLAAPAYILQKGVQRCLDIPLRRGGRLVGLQIVFNRSERAPFTPLQLRIAQGIAQLAGLALESARLVEQVTRANRVKSDFVATVSHELRTPLNVILGYVDLLVRGEYGTVPEEFKEPLQTIRRSAAGLGELIIGTLEAARLEAGRADLHVEDIPLRAFLNEVFDEVRIAAGKPGVDMRCELPERVPSLRTDRAKLRVVLKNLLENACKFTHGGEIALGVRRTRGGVEISVADTGIGMTRQVQEIAFEPFRQGESALTRQYGGVGLGLYVARRLVELLGGRIAVESEPNAGSTFRVWLPAARR